MASKVSPFVTRDPSSTRTCLTRPETSVAMFISVPSMVPDAEISLLLFPEQQINTRVSKHAATYFISSPIVWCIEFSWQNLLQNRDYFLLPRLARDDNLMVL